ncbi:pyridoxamine 5'-phosphate oxidase [Rhodothalassium salexigens DSM 2132]|uniref:Pyridoxine/pyridoxamine 5'-phosphate oxidase n=1 Tax=Rhodothalassium salexigens DSM 2132 TaxID=1188247 RepID=A0A4R2PHB8_RHOSA|nr:pyridoxamine 5'-phosphate oxidase [Rhodothalassium salexigens]MBB4211774.1 pyridoxamine 5'-phosphate oxidase [Rhodothalassium salexigens DSM 2132]MBK1639639.1 pyridoxamine 5'-phosphate oxidase [Rhodothalassium salexigens DSM 2132]TCP33928.1 pyridoxamine 5'-phosphate oxidase [Rhodothalassium salexigens DSM 2132]
MSFVPDASTDPFTAFERWFAEAEASEPSDPNAMILSTADARGRPAARAVLLKGWDRSGFVFYTNLRSDKGHHLTENPQASLLFYWKIAYRQVRIEGRVEPVPAADADAYFASRPRGSQIGAWASDQSHPLPGGRVELEQRIADMEKRYEGQEVPRPPHWSGYCVIPDRFEFWQGQEYRLHDRMVYSRDGERWTFGLLFP